MKNPRIQVSVNSSNYEVMSILCEKKEVSMSSLVSQMIDDWLEDYEDFHLAMRAEKAEQRWIAGGKKTISHEEVCRRLGIE